MSTRYEEPNRIARAGNAVVRWLAELGISIAGTRALQIRGRKTGKPRAVVVNLLTSHRAATPSGRATSEPRASSRSGRAGAGGALRSTKSATTRNPSC
jgi:hypothetical protein